MHVLTMYANSKIAYIADIAYIVTRCWKGKGNQYIQLVKDL